MTNWKWQITILAVVLIAAITIICWKESDNPVVKLGSKEKIYDKESKEIKSEDLGALNIKGATSISLAGIELEKTKAELQAGIKMKETKEQDNQVHPSPFRFITKVISLYPHESPQPQPNIVQNNNGWEGPVSELNRKVDDNREYSDKRFDKLEGDVSDVNKGVNWLINQSQVPDKKVTEEIRGQQKQKVTNNTEE
jgi:hypothetical protein